MTQRECQVTIQSLRDSPYSLEFKDQIVARIMSYNSFGWSLWSDANTGDAIILTEPAIMQTPVYMPLLSTGTTVVLDLIELTTFDEIGGSPILEYKVEINEVGIWTTIQGSPSLDLQVSIPNLVIGQTY